MSNEKVVKLHQIINLVNNGYNEIRFLTPTDSITYIPDGDLGQYGEYIVNNIWFSHLFNSLMIEISN